MNEGMTKVTLLPGRNEGAIDVGLRNVRFLAKSEG